MIPLIDGLSFHVWAGCVILESGASDPYLPDENDWKSWARQVVASPVFRGNTPPDPETYESWQSWANDFLRVSSI